MLIYDNKECKLFCGNTKEELKQIESDSVHCIVTSPPYHMQRNYQVDGQIGMEPNPHLFVKNLVDVFSEVKRCLHPTGTLWINIGDSFTTGSVGRDRTTKTDSHVPKDFSTVGPVGIPWMLVQAMRESGWLLRSEMIWIKLAPLPESVNGWRWEQHRIKSESSNGSKTSYTSKGHQSPQGLSANGVINGSAEWEDCPGCEKCIPNKGLILRKGSWRCTRAHEYIFMFSKSEKYYCDAEAVKQQARSSTIMRDRYTRILDDEDEQYSVKHNHDTDSEGKSNPRTWLVFKGEPNKEQHYATFPSELPTFCIKAGTSQKGCCSHCKVPWSRVVIPRTIITGTRDTAKGLAKNDGRWEYPRGINSNRTIGWKQSCNCPEHDPIPCLVLDPFAGTCTTGKSSIKLKRNFIGIDLNEEYLVDFGMKKLEKAIKKRGFGLV